MRGLPIKSERANTVTHLAGAAFALSSIWMVWPAVHHSWQMAFGVLFFIVGMFIMFALSASYHWVYPGRAKRVMRIFDHIGIYVMIACSYTPPSSGASSIRCSPWAASPAFRWRFI